MVDASGSVDIGTIQLHYSDGASAQRIWRYAMRAPYAIDLSPLVKLVRNLSIPGEAACHGTPAVSIEPGSSYTFEAPMAATGTAAYAGYVTVIFLDASCTGILRSNIYFGPSRIPVATDGPGHGVVAVDPRIIPLGTHLFIPGYGRAYAGDTGGAIRGKRIDLGFESERAAIRFGRRAIIVYLERTIPLAQLATIRTVGL